MLGPWRPAIREPWWAAITRSRAPSPVAPWARSIARSTTRRAASSPSSACSIRRTSRASRSRRGCWLSSTTRASCASSTTSATPATTTSSWSSSTARASTSASWPRARRGCRWTRSSSGAARRARRWTTSTSSTSSTATSSRRTSSWPIAAPRPTRRSSPSSRSCARPRPLTLREAARQGQVHRPRADREAARPRLLPGARHVRPPPHHDFDMQKNRPWGDAVVTGHGTIDGRRVCVFSPGLHRLRRLARRGHGREDVQDHGPGGQDRLPGDRHQRLRRRAHPGGRRLARRLRRRLRAQRPVLGRDPADLADHGPVRGRRRLLAGDDRLHLHGQGDLAHVHHRPRRDQDGHRRGGRLRGARRRDDATTRSRASRTSPPTTRTQCLEDARYLLSFLPQNNLETRRASSRPTTRCAWTRSSTRSSPTTRTSPTTCAT
jgi:hypothetical protein